MPKYFAVLTIFLIPPFAFFYFYLVFAHAFNLPTVSRQQFFPSETLAWIGVVFCLTGLALLAWSLVSFFEPRRHKDTEKNKGKTLCPCVSVAKGFVRPFSDDYTKFDFSLQKSAICSQVLYNQRIVLHAKGVDHATQDAASNTGV
jgi:hypothetical protein